MVDKQNLYNNLEKYLEDFLLLNINCSINWFDKINTASHDIKRRFFSANHNSTANDCHEDQWQNSYFSLSMTVYFSPFSPSATINCVGKNLSWALKHHSMGVAFKHISTSILLHIFCVWPFDRVYCVPSKLIKSPSHWWHIWVTKYVRDYKL